MRYPSLATVRRIFAPSVILVLVLLIAVAAGGGYFFGFERGKEEVAATKDKIEQHAKRSTHLFSGYLTKIEENSWSLRVEGGEELTITDEFPETPPSFVLTSFPEGSFPEGKTTEVKREEILIGDKVDIQIGITPRTGKTEVLRITKYIYQ